jgi:hypothetical protein
MNFMKSAAEMVPAAAWAAAAAAWVAAAAWAAAWASAAAWAARDIGVCRLDMMMDDSSIGSISRTEQRATAILVGRDGEATGAVAVERWLVLSTATVSRRGGAQLVVERKGRSTEASAAVDDGGGPATLDDGKVRSATRVVAVGGGRARWRSLATVDDGAVDDGAVGSAAIALVLVAVEHRGRSTMASVVAVL